jgi:hypothetical protein
MSHNSGQQYAASSYSLFMFSAPLRHYLASPCTTHYTLPTSTQIFLQLLTLLPHRKHAILVTYETSATFSIIRFLEWQPISSLILTIPRFFFYSSGSCPCLSLLSLTTCNLMPGYQLTWLDVRERYLITFTLVSLAGLTFLAHIYISVSCHRLSVDWLYRRVSYYCLLIYSMHTSLSFSRIVDLAPEYML